MAERNITLVDCALGRFSASCFVVYVRVFKPGINGLISLPQKYKPTLEIYWPPPKNNLTNQVLMLVSVYFVEFRFFLAQPMKMMRIESIFDVCFPILDMNREILVDLDRSIRE